MEMRHEATGGGHIFYNLVRQQIGLNRRNAITLNAFYLIECFHQIEESLAGRFSEISDIDSGQHNLFPTFGSSLPCLLHQRCDSPVATPSTGKRNGTVRTKVIAPILYFQEKAGTVTS